MIRATRCPRWARSGPSEARFEAMLRVELAVARAQVARGLVPAEALEAIDGARPDRRGADRRDRADHRPRRHRLRQPGRRDGRAGGPLPPPGLTSSDVVDTGARAPVRAAGDLLLADVDALLAALVGARPAEADTVMMGRTHSVHAEPITLGLKLAAWAFELDRDRQRLAARRSTTSRPARSRGRSERTATWPRTSRRRCSPTSACRRPGQHPDRPARPPRRAPRRDRDHRRLAGALRDRDPQPPAHRDRRAEGAVPERPEGQLGDAPQAQPDPVASGSPASPACCAATPSAALENQPLWHERDISHSSAERVILPGRHDPSRLHAGQDDRARRGARGPAGADAREHRARPGAPRQQPRPRRARRGGRPVARGGLRDRPAQRPPRGRRAASAPRAAGRPTPRSPAASPRAAWTPASTTPASCATCRRSSRGSTPSTRSAAGRDGARWRAPRRRTRVDGPSCCALTGFVRSGKVRDLYAPRRRTPAARRLATGSRAFDVVLPTPIPDKGRVLTGLSRFWFARDRPASSPTTSWARTRRPCRADRCRPEPPPSCAAG